MKQLHSLSALIASDKHLSRLCEKAALLSSLQRAVDRVTPTELAGKCTVANVRGQALVIHASTNAAAARLRLTLPRLLATVQESSRDLNAIKVEVQIPTSATSGPGQSRKSVLSTHASDALRGLEARLPASRLREAVGSLAKKSQL
ncbi:MAG: DciA family protein [Burkholderiales bacterium]